MSWVEKLWWIHDDNSNVEIDKDTAICIIRHLALQTIENAGYRIIHAENQYHLLNGDTIEYSNSDRDWLIYYTCLGLS